MAGYFSMGAMKMCYYFIYSIVNILHKYASPINILLTWCCSLIDKQQFISNSGRPHPLEKKEMAIYTNKESCTEMIMPERQ